MYKKHFEIQFVIFSINLTTPNTLRQKCVAIQKRDERVCQNNTKTILDHKNKKGFENSACKSTCFEAILEDRYAKKVAIALAIALKKAM